VRKPAGLLLLLAALLAVPAAADTVHLKNGRAYEGVIAERTPQGVRVQLAFGHIVIPDDQVLAVEKAPSALAGYLARKAELLAKPDGAAPAWLELARWAKVNDLPSASREAALLAAELDPRQPGLDVLLRPLGLVFEEALVRWIPYEESMVRRGLVRFEGEWISVEERRARLADLERRRAAWDQEMATRRLADAAEAMRRNEERRAIREAAEQASRLAYPTYLPVVTFPGFWFPPVVVVVNPPDGQPTPAPSPRHTYTRVGQRQPGSFLPVAGEPIVPRDVLTSPTGMTTSSSSSGGN
jgi:hypothetical protein